MKDANINKMDALQIRQDDSFSFMLLFWSLYECKKISQPICSSETKRINIPKLYLQLDFERTFRTSNYSNHVRPRAVLESCRFRGVKSNKRELRRAINDDSHRLLMQLCIWTWTQGNMLGSTFCTKSKANGRCALWPFGCFCIQNLRSNWINNELAKNSLQVIMKGVCCRMFLHFLLLFWVLRIVEFYCIVTNDYEC